MPSYVAFFWKINKALLILLQQMLCEIGSRPSRKWILFTFFFFFFLSVADPTRITQGPADMEIIVGESIVLPCQVTSDPVLDVSFSWAFNGQLIAKGDGHFELVGGVSDPQSYFFRTCEWAVGTSSHLASLHRCHHLKETACGLTSWYLSERFTVAALAAA